MELDISVLRDLHSITECHRFIRGFKEDFPVSVEHTAPFHWVFWMLANKREHEPGTNECCGMRWATENAVFDSPVYPRFDMIAVIFDVGNGGTGVMAHLPYYRDGDWGADLVVRASDETAAVKLLMIVPAIEGAMGLDT
mgnify:CR=1 FL=1